MSNVLCSIAVVDQLVAADLEDFELALQADSLQLQKPSIKRFFGVDDTFVLLVAGVVSGAAAAVQLVDYGVKASKAIIDWRKKMRAKDLDAYCVLKHPNRPSLDLRTASDEEILEWFQR